MTRNLVRTSTSTAALLILAGSVLTGCAKVRYPNYYVLTPAPPSPSARSAAPLAESVEVRPFSAPPFLREGPIVYRQAPRELSFYDYHRWAEDPRRVATTTMIQDLDARRIFRSVAPFDGHSSAAFLLTGSLDHLEEVDDGSAVSVQVTISAVLRNLKTGDIIWRDTSSKTALVEQRSVPGIVAEMSRNLGGAIQDLISSMQNQLRQNSDAGQ
ncbi:MAG TPA: ABC-type transport auxiliary lipoprotein family protein [Bryobacteraceae bacterium]|nr:ABC-type transport auxiliary lipoprotein family protein [Bryobacteraceae bacterium]